MENTENNCEYPEYYEFMKTPDSNDTLEEVVNKEERNTPPKKKQKSGSIETPDAIKNANAMQETTLDPPEIDVTCGINGYWDEIDSASEIPVSNATSSQSPQDLTKKLKKRACDECSARKIPCEFSPNPRCQNCVKNNRECLLTTTSGYKESCFPCFRDKAGCRGMKTNMECTRCHILGNGCVKLVDMIKAHLNNLKEIDVREREELVSKRMSEIVPGNLKLVEQVKKLLKRLRS